MNVVRSWCKDWESSAAVARAFSIGRNESQAVTQLLCHIHPKVKDGLVQAVRKRGVTKFLSHEVLAKQVFSQAWSSGQQAMEAWCDQLTNAAGEPKIAFWLRL